MYIYMGCNEWGGDRGVYRHSARVVRDVCRCVYIGVQVGRRGVEIVVGFFGDVIDRGGRETAATRTFYSESE